MKMTIYSVNLLLFRPLDRFSNGCLEMTSAL